MNERWNYDPFENYASVKYCEKMAAEARRAKCWINVGKQWFTPEEFVKYVNENVREDASDMTYVKSEDLKIKDPRPVVKKMNEEIIKMVDIRDEFVRKLLDYLKD